MVAYSMGESNSVLFGSGCCFLSTYETEWRLGLFVEVGSSCVGSGVFTEKDISGLFFMIVRIYHTFCSFTCSSGFFLFFFNSSQPFRSYFSHGMISSHITDNRYYSLFPVKLWCDLYLHMLFPYLLCHKAYNSFWDHQSRSHLIFIYLKKTRKDNSGKDKLNFHGI